LANAGNKIAGKEKTPMNCEDFKALIVSDDADKLELEKHLESCDDCAKWLNRELSSPPEGLSKAEWQSATSRCMPKLDNQAESKEPEVLPPPVSRGFFTGLKYGLVFGLSIITGLAIVQLHQESQTDKPLKRMEIQSFVDESSLEMPVFYEKEFSDVTFFDYGDSKLLSFVEDEEIPSFIEEDTQEEDLWTETDSS
jgi:hypothetical protein